MNRVYQAEENVGKAFWAEGIGYAKARKESLCLKKVKAKSLSRVRLFVTPWIVAMEFSSQEYWSGLTISFSRGSS